MTRDLPPFLCNMLAASPRAGQGVHAWLVTIARQLHAHLLVGEIIALLASGVANCGRHVPRKEIEDAVTNSVACAWQPARAAFRPAAKWPTPNQEQREAIIHDGRGLA